MAKPCLGDMMKPHFAYDQHWCAIYTAPRHEKKVAEQLHQRSIEHYCPTYRVARRWNNGCTMQLDLPLFPSYLFVRISQDSRASVMSVDGVHSVLRSGRELFTIPDSEIELLRNAVQRGACEPHPYLSVGQRVRIKQGPLIGTEGILVRKKNMLRVVVAVDLIMQAMSVEIDAELVEPIAGYVVPRLAN
jgi:transcription antitermination factor NusG